MNKDLLNLIPDDEKPVARQLSTVAEEMQPSQIFQSELEDQLLQRVTSSPPSPGQGWFSRLAIPAGWAIAAVTGMLLLGWTIRSLVPQTTPAAGASTAPVVSFAEHIRAGDICSGQLALGHGFDVFLTNERKTGFVRVDQEKQIGELRSFAWSPDGARLAIVGNTRGSGNIHVSDPDGGQLEHLLASGSVGYLMDVAWSRDGKQLAMWSSQNNQVLYLLNMEGTGLVERPLGSVQILGRQQFWPDGGSVVFYGASPNEQGLFEIILVSQDLAPAGVSVEEEGAYAFSPDGTRLAYMEYDRETGQAGLFSLDLATRQIVGLGALAVPKGSGSSLPDTANLSWSPDGTVLVFDFGRHAADRAVYLAQEDGAGLIRIAESAYAPAISADGRCLAYISAQQVLLKDLQEVSLRLAAQVPVLLAELPAGRGASNFRQDRLQWQP